MHNLSTVERQSWLVWFLSGVLLLGMLVLFARLTELQVIKGEYFHALAEGNRIRKVPITAARGEILARGGEVLVGNKEQKKAIIFDPAEGYTKKDPEPGTPEDEIITEWARNYVLGADFAHASGYLSLVSPEEVGKVDAQCPHKGPRITNSYIGRGGLEEQYSCALRGLDGEELVEVDTFGKKIRTLGTKSPTPGSAVSTTIDYGLQKKVAEIFKNKEELPAERKGAVVATDGKGEILAFYSSPSFDPTAFMQQSEGQQKEVQQLLSDPQLPLFNRVVGGAYHPGSIFKLVTSIAALEDGKIKKDTLYDDPGVIRVNEFEYNNWYLTQYGKTEGSINLARALARSTDTYYYKLGEYVGAESLASWAQKFGLGAKTGVDIPGEIAGLVPTPQWKKEYKKENWFLGNTYHMAIGQGDLTSTPLESNIMTAVIANGGKLCTPHFVTQQGKNYCNELPIKQEHIKAVHEGMLAACATGGTAFPFFDFEPKVACKTGTAETEEEDKTHAWFTIYAPAVNPEIVLTLLVEKGGEGSSVAAPVAKDILQYWFHERNSAQR